MTARLDAAPARLQHSRMLRLLTIAFVLASTSVTARAQTAAPRDSTAGAHAHVSPAFGIHYGSPLRTSGSIGGLFDFNGNRNDGVVLVFEPGQQGTGGSAGYFKMFGHLGTGYSVRGAFYRMHSEPWNATPYTSYAGIEGHWLLIFGVGGRMGYLRRVSHSTANPIESIVSLGVSIGH